ncbi:MAG: HD domain-containing protein [Ignavibacteriaceae bacterium]
MLSQTDLIILKKGDPVDHYFIVRKCEIRLTKSNKQYLAIDLGDKTSTICSYIWENFDTIYARIKSGDIVKVAGAIDDYQGTPQLKINVIRPLKDMENVSPLDFMAKSKRDPDEMKNEFVNRIERISDLRLRSLMQIIFNEDNFEKFSTAPAGKSWHHSYIHGLIEHTLEIIKICDMMCEIHPEVNRDLLICGAMMHDFGKTEELKYDTVFEYSDKGKLLGHIVISAMKINEEAGKIPGFPDDLKDCLIHLVLSHQGKLEFASPVVPKTIEAIILYQADELSAKTNAYKNALSEVRGDARWTKYLSLISTELFNHGITPELEEQINKTLFD